MAEKKAAKKEAAKGPSKREERHALKLKVLVKENPKREDTKGHIHFELYKKSKTVGDFLKAGGTNADLAYDAKHKFISIG